MITENVLKEWYTENAARRFPLANPIPQAGAQPSGLSDNGTPLPNALMVGMQLTVPRTMLATREAGSTLPYDTLADEYRIYVSRVVISLTRVEVTFTTVSGEDVALAVWTPTSEIQGLPVHGVAITPLATNDDNIGVNNIFGYLFLGPDSVWTQAAGVYTFTGDNIYNSMVSESVIAVDDANRVTGIIVNGIKLTGDVTLVAGENTRMSVSGNELVAEFAGSLENGISSRSDLLTEIIALYGDPVLTINGIPADGDGDYTIAPADDCASISSVQHGITVTGTCGDECCDQGVLADLSSNIQAVNVKASRMEAFMKATSELVNALQNELAYLKMTANQ